VAHLDPSLKIDTTWPMLNSFANDQTLSPTDC
jgi:hypothetical protein